MHTRRTILGPADVHAAGVKLDLMPLQIAQLGGPKAIADIRSRSSSRPDGRSGSTCGPPPSRSRSQHRSDTSASEQLRNLQWSVAEPSVKLESHDNPRPPDFRLGNYQPFFPQCQSPIVAGMQHSGANRRERKTVAAMAQNCALACAFRPEYQNLPKTWPTSRWPRSPQIFTMKELVRAPHLCRLLLAFDFETSTSGLRRGRNEHRARDGDRAGVMP